MGYSVMIKEVESGDMQRMFISGAGTTNTTVSDLLPTRKYSIQVAAINNVGTGSYTAPDYVSLPQTGKYRLTHGYGEYT